MTIKLALIGKGISHSKSQIMYESIIGQAVDYQLLDFQSEQDIPEAYDLLDKFDGISITAPYKKYFCNEVNLCETASELGAINCLYRDDRGGPMGANTDFSALQTLVPKMLKKYFPDQIIILGNGTMADVVARILLSQDRSFKQYTRKKYGDLTHIDLSLDSSSPLVINCCSRSFRFDGGISLHATFWDLNYAHPHSDILPFLCDYIDGEELLFEQAKVALRHWGISTP